MERDFLNASNYPRGENRFIKSNFYYFIHEQGKLRTSCRRRCAKRTHARWCGYHVVLCYGCKNYSDEWNENITERINKLFNEFITCSDVDFLPWKRPHRLKPIQIEWKSVDKLNGFLPVVPSFVSIDLMAVQVATKSFAAFVDSVNKTHAAAKALLEWSYDWI